MPVRRTDRFDELKRHMIKVAERVTPQAAEIINAAAKRKITEKDFIETGTLRRSGFVSKPELIGDSTVRVTISYPLVYAPWIEFGTRRLANGTVVKMRSKDPGFLYEAMVEESSKVRNFIAVSMRNVLAAFR